jgi:NusA-like KH domain protein
VLNIKFDENILKAMSYFEKITHAKLKDCILSEKSTLYIVHEGFIAKAIGKKAVNVHKLQEKLNRKIKIVEFNPNVQQFIKNYIFPLKVTNITQDGSIITIEGEDTKTKGLLIGRNAQNLRNLESVVKRYFDIQEIKVV